MIKSSSLIKYVRALIAVTVVAFLLIMPDTIFALINKSFCVTRDPKAILFIVPLSVGLVMSGRLSLSILLFFALLQIAQFCHIAYFGTQLSPFSLHLMTKEIADVLSEAKSIFLSYLYIAAIVALPFAAIYVFCRYGIVRFGKPIWGMVIILTVILSVGCRLYMANTPRFVPNEIRFTLDNSVKSFWGYWLIMIRNYNLKNYRPYAINRIREVKERTTVVYIIGESCNQMHMSLFGYHRDTTPELRRMSKSDNFYYIGGIAGSISTLSSCKFLFNAVREGNNVRQTSLDTTNLFRLAKESGFKTFYISAQSDHLFSSIGGVKYMDVFVTNDSYPMQFERKKDELLLEILQNQKFEQKNFVVIHQRCIHSPYAGTYADGYTPKIYFKGAENRIIDEYDNAMLYNDFLISSMFKMFNKFPGNFYIFWVSDHNESLGENGLWGHGHGKLAPQSAQIPIIIQSNDSTFMKSVKTKFLPTHYDICNSIITLFGFELLNPNEEENVYYITGIDYNGKCGYIRLKKDPLEKKISYSQVLYD